MAVPAQRAPANNMRSLGVLLPVTSKGSSLAALADGLQGLAAACACPGPGHTAVRFVLGLDEDDPLLGQQQEEAGAGQLVRALGAHRTTVRTCAASQPVRAHIGRRTCPAAVPDAMQRAT